MIKIKPDFSKPLLINNTNATVTTAGWANPENALFGSIKPNKTNNLFKSNYKDNERVTNMERAQ